MLGVGATLTRAGTGFTQVQVRPSAAAAAAARCCRAGQAKDRVGRPGATSGVSGTCAQGPCWRPAVRSCQDVHSPAALRGPHLPSACSPVPSHLAATLQRKQLSELLEDLLDVLLKVG